MNSADERLMRTHSGRHPTAGLGVAFVDHVIRLPELLRRQLGLTQALVDSTEQIVTWAVAGLQTSLLVRLRVERLPGDSRLKYAFPNS